MQKKPYDLMTHFKIIGYILCFGVVLPFTISSQNNEAVMLGIGSLLTVIYFLILDVIRIVESFKKGETENEEDLV